MSTADIARLGRNLKPAMVLGAAHTTLVREHAIVVAIQAGLDFQGDVFKYVIRGQHESDQERLDWVQGLWRSRVPVDGNDVMRRLSVNRDEACNPDAAARWLACLCRYLLAEPSLDEEDLLPRPQRFLQAISASPWLPLEISEKYEVFRSRNILLCFDLAERYD